MVLLQQFPQSEYAASEDLHHPRAHFGLSGVFAVCCFNRILCLFIQTRLWEGKCRDWLSNLCWTVADLGSSLGPLILCKKKTQQEEKRRGKQKNRTPLAQGLDPPLLAILTPITVADVCNNGSVHVVLRHARSRIQSSRLFLSPKLRGEKITWRGSISVKTTLIRRDEAQIINYIRKTDPL